MLSSCEGADMLRMTTAPNRGWTGPQYRGFGRSVSWDNGSIEASTYGPLPAPADSLESNQLSAVSVFEASGASDPPCCRTSRALTIPVAGFASTAGSCGSGAAVFTTTVYLSFA